MKSLFGFLQFIITDAIYVPITKNLPGMFLVGKKNFN